VDIALSLKHFMKFVVVTSGMLLACSCYRFKIHSYAMTPLFSLIPQLHTQ